MKDIPAFPVPSYVNKDGETHDVEFKGMTLRDYFAAKALQGLLASEVNAPMQTFAVRAYKIANEMMKAREKESLND
jgi:hypothetical protein